MDPQLILNSRSPRFWWLFCMALLLCVTALDAVTGSALSFVVLYLLPVALMTWFVGRREGLWMCGLAALAWLVADVTGDAAVQTHMAILWWNAGVRFGVFAVVALLLPAAKLLRREQELARIDPLTGAANRRRLCEAVHHELLRSRRYRRPMTVAFVDLDGFKRVNDELGHAAGDKVLCAVVDRINHIVRQTDLLARVGGDEFVLLLPEIDQEAAKVIVPKLHLALTEEMLRESWPVTFSIGVMTWRDGVVTAEELIARADRLMYDIKHRGKNAIAYAVFGEPAQESASGPQTEAMAVAGS